MFLSISATKRRLGLAALLLETGGPLSLLFISYNEPNPVSSETSLLRNCNLFLKAEAVRLCCFLRDGLFPSICLHDCILCLQAKASFGWHRQVKEKPKGETCLVAFC